MPQLSPSKEGGSVKAEPPPLHTRPLNVTTAGRERRKAEVLVCGTEGGRGLYKQQVV